MPKLSSINLFLNALSFSCALIKSWVMPGASIPLEIESYGSILKWFMNVAVNVDKRLSLSVLALFILVCTRSGCKCC